MKRDANQLMSDYKPLILSVYRRFHPLFRSKEDKEDLMSQINTIFYKLVLEYDPRRGVDFPFYIKRMLELRTYHYVTKQTKQKKREVITDFMATGQFDFNREDESTVDKKMEELINVLSWEDDFSMGKKQRKLFLDLIQDRKTLHELADEEGVDVSTIHTRMHFLVKKLKKQTEEQKQKEKKQDLSEDE